jgi:hypothetical protein
MHNYSKGISAGRKSCFLRPALFLMLIFYSIPVQCQSIPNLEIFYKLADSIAINTSKNIPQNKKEVKLDLGTGSAYSIFNNRIIEGFQNSGKKVVPGPKYDSMTTAEVSIIIDGSNVNYAELFQEKLFGGFFAKREITLSGNYIIFSPGVMSHNFNYSSTDTVNLNEVRNLENNALPFTQGKIPPEPLFSSIYEPVIAVGAAALTVILFFTIRSK